MDREPEKYTIKRLTKWKRHREDRFAAVGDTLRQRYVGEIVDDAKAGTISTPRTLKRYTRYLEKNRFSHTIDSRTLEAIKDYVRGGDCALQAPGSRSRNERHSMGITQFKSIPGARKVWPQ